MTFAEKVKEAMERQGVDCSALAAAAGLSKNAVWALLSGRSAGAAATRFKIAQALGFDMAEVFPEDPNMTIGKWARLNRLRRGYTRNRLAVESGVTDPTVYKLESDGGAINMYSLIQMANTLKIGLDEYIGRKIPT